MPLQVRPSEVNKRIAAVANELDQERPGWADRVDLDSLNMYSLYKCVLAQVYGGDKYDDVHLTGWSYGLKRLEIRFGPDVGRGEVTADHRELWVEQIIQRQTKAADTESVRREPLVSV